MPSPRRVPLASLNPGERLLDAALSHYLVKVLRLGRGQGFVVFDPAAGLEANAELLRAHPREACCRIGGLRGAAPVPGPRVTLVQALGKSTKPERVVRDATALGASRVVVVASERAVVRPGQSSAGRRLARWRAVALDAARQCGRGDLPEIEGPVSLERACEATSRGEVVRFCLDARATTPLRSHLAAVQPSTHYGLAIGPEGGWSQCEREQLQHNGWKLVSLGPYTLRTELAATVSLSLLLIGAELG